MATYKVAELEGALLDAAVAKAEGWVRTRSQYGDRSELWDTGGGFYRVEGPAGHLGDERWRPSTWWGHGGPIIERERINLVRLRDGEWWAEPASESQQSLEGVTVAASPKGHSGRTPLTAAMRAYISSKSGDKVVLP